jgi:2',3'-cyclic-nucleotide 2'-phosphodiesterase (5'-nucleotidase family)
MTRKLVAGAIAALALLAMGASAFAQTLGRLDVPLDGAKSAVAETNLGDLVADAVRAAGEADFAFIQASALQPVTVTAGDIDVGRARGMLVLPDEAIIVMRLEGARVREALERSLAVLPYPNKGFLQVSGLKVRFDSAAPAGARTQSIIPTFSQATFDQNKTYRVAAPESLARGALGYFRVFDSAPREKAGVTLIQALTRFIAAKSPVAPRVEGRLQAVE